MEKLEKTLEKIPIEALEPKSEEFYEGLRLVEEKVYNSGTGVKYWM